jgi:hypothetical protein
MAALVGHRLVGAYYCYLGLGEIDPSNILNPQSRYIPTKNGKYFLRAFIIGAELAGPPLGLVPNFSQKNFGEDDVQPTSLCQLCSEMRDVAQVNQAVVDVNLKTKKKG